MAIERWVGGVFKGEERGVRSQESEGKRQKVNVLKHCMSLA
jgi:hypothetical protein